MKTKTLIMGFIIIPVLIAGLRLFAGQFDGTPVFYWFMIPFYLSFILLIIYWFKIFVYYLDKYNQ